MQLIHSYLYTPKIRVIISDMGVTNIQEQQVYNHVIQLYKGTDNPVQVRFLNQDQKKKDVTNYTFVVAVMNTDQGQTIFYPTLTVTDAAAGQGTVTFTEEQMNNLDAMRYTLAIKGTVNGVEAPVYSDDNFNMSVDLHVNEGFLPSA
jgi:hypothetical protein